MATDIDKQHRVPDQETDAETAKRNRLRPLRYALGVVLVAIFVLSGWKRGLPRDQVQIIAWVWAAAVVWGVGRPWRRQIEFLRDWIPVLAVLLAYQYSAGVADIMGMPVHVDFAIDVDKAMFAGVLPTHWLQAHLYRSQVQWYDAVLSVVYFSHFVTCLTIAAVLWFRDRVTWASFMRRFLIASVLGVVGYILFPAAPPWWAATHDYISAVPRLTGRGWDLLGIPTAGAVISHGQARGNALAAIPSLHAAFSLLSVVFFMPRIHKRWWPLMLAYPAAMGFGLVYFGEHYVTDLILGWLLIGAVLIGVHRGECWWAQRRSASEESAQAGRAPDAPVPAEQSPTAVSIGDRRALRWVAAIPFVLVLLGLAGNAVAGAREDATDRTGESAEKTLALAPSSAEGGGRCSDVVYTALAQTPDSIERGFSHHTDHRRLVALYGAHSPTVRAFDQVEPEVAAYWSTWSNARSTDSGRTVSRRVQPDVVRACRSFGGVIAESWAPAEARTQLSPATLKRFRDADRLAARNH